jgi:hypothetical protein
MNAVLEQHLHVYVSYLQDDWVDWLPYTEFSANSMESETNRMTPFFANYGYHLRLGTEPREAPGTPTTRQADSCSDHMAMILESFQEQALLA